MSQIAGDEGLHHAFYRDLTAAALEIDPSYVVVAICRQLRGFKMPGTGIPGFAAHERIIADAGIFDAEQYLRLVVEPTLGVWGIDDIEGLDSDAEQARDRIHRTVETLARIAKSTAKVRD